MIVLFTDFGREGPYVGQMKAVLHRQAPSAPVIDLFADAPAHDPQASAYLLAAYAGEFPEGTVFLCVVDPGVGSERGAVVLEADGCWYVGPDNGLFELVGRRAEKPAWREITWRPESLSASFHGRDLFAPVAAALARGDAPPGEIRPPEVHGRPEWPDDLPRIIYADHFGNAMTGLRAAVLPGKARLQAGGRIVNPARTFSDVPQGEAFWYENANGLAEIAVNRGRADQTLGLTVGAAVKVIAGD